jgi:hypothetical protein
VSDDVPDFYAVTFTSMTGLIEKYGRNSPQVEAGARLFDATLPQVVSKFQSLYPNRLVTEVVLMGSSQANDASVVAEVNALFPQVNAAAYYPNIYLDKSSKDVAKTCEHMASKLNTKNIAVYCPAVNLYSFSLMSSSTDNSTNSTSPTQQQIETYQIVVWWSIGAAFVTVWAVYVLGWMAFKKDTFLYSTFNPNWEDRKRR